MMSRKDVQGNDNGPPTWKEEENHKELPGRDSNPILPYTMEC